MEIKLFEVRDRMTFIPVVCIKIDPANDEERYLWAAAGYGVTAEDQKKYGLLMARALELKFVDHPHAHPGWPTVRTLPVAHSYIQQNWAELQSGEVIDVEFIKGETSEKKISQSKTQC